MKATDLRIGNLVELPPSPLAPSFDTKIVKILGLGTDSISGKSYISSVGGLGGDAKGHLYCEGIVITPDWLKDLGFKHAKTKEEVWDQIKISYLDEVFWIEGLYFLVNDGDQWQLHFATDEDNESYIGKSMKYIYELQNLYFYLEKEELKYKKI